MSAIQITTGLTVKIKIQTKVIYFWVYNLSGYVVEVWIFPIPTLSQDAGQWRHFACSLKIDKIVVLSDSKGKKGHWKWDLNVLPYTKEVHSPLLLLSTLLSILHSKWRHSQVSWLMVGIGKTRTSTTGNQNTLKTWEIFSQFHNFFKKHGICFSFQRKIVRNIK